MRCKTDALVTGKSGEIFRGLTSGIPSDLSPSQFAASAWAAWGEQSARQVEGSKQVVGGKIFELIVAAMLEKSGILPFYYQAELELVPDVQFDLFCYHPYTPAVVSVKSSLRERYKQAALEATALKQVYPRGVCYLVTAAENEARNLNVKIKEARVRGLDECIVVHTPDFDRMLDKMSKTRFCEAVPIAPIKHNQAVIV